MHIAGLVCNMQPEAHTSRFLWPSMAEIITKNIEFEWNTSRAGQDLYFLQCLIN